MNVGDLEQEVSYTMHLRVPIKEPVHRSNFTFTVKLVVIVKRENSVRPLSSPPHMKRHTGMAETVCGTRLSYCSYHSHRLKCHTVRDTLIGTLKQYLLY